MSSLRFPGKVLAPLAGVPLLLHVFRAASAGTGEGIVATSDAATDDPIETFCRAHGIRVFRGALHDVAGRLAQAGAWAGFSDIVRISGDSPLLRSHVVAEVIDAYRQGNVDVATNVWPRSFPKGQSVEIVATRTLLNASSEAMSAAEREHVMPWFYARPERYEIRNVAHDPDLSTISMVVDTPTDLRKLENALEARRVDLRRVDLRELVEVVARARSRNTPEATDTDAVNP